VLPLIGEIKCILITKLGRNTTHSDSIFARIVRPMNVLQLCRWQFSQTLCSRLSSSEVRF